MSGDLALFGDDDREKQPPPPRPSDGQIADWLIKSVRDELTARGILSMPDRQKTIESIAGRPISTLRELTRAEALKIVAILGSKPNPTAGPASAWDSREDVTWIDRI